jgi:hypothetical protein
MQQQAADLRTLAAEAYVFGFPLVFNLTQVARFVHDGLGSLPPAPWNGFSHAAELAGPQDTFVTVNNDTIYSIAQLDLSVGPLRFEVPDAADRYYVMQFVDAWTNNFAYVGRRATGTHAGSFLIVPPDWTDPLPDGTRTIRAPTAVAVIVGRWAVDGDADLAAVRELQQALRLEPLDPAATGAGLPEPDPGVPGDLRFYEQLRVWAQAFPPAPGEQDYQQRFAPLGVLDADSPYTDADGELAAALRDGQALGEQQLEKAVRHGDSPEVNQWQLTFHVFDYNDDYFEVGTLDDPRWRIADRQKARLLRAGSACGGLWGNHAYEAAYAMSYNDSSGEQLTGERRYVIRFEQPPPVGAFWSITMYDLPDYFLVANPIERYSIGDRTPGLRYDADGGLTITIQHDDPGEPERSNWLPTPAGAFRPVLRMYQPAKPVLDGSYELPPIIRLG